MSLKKEQKEIKKTYCRKSDKWLYKDRQKSWENDYKEYIKDGKWDYDFKYELTVGDCEQSFLSQMIFGHLFIRGLDYHSFLVKRYYMLVNRNDEKNICFHFDVMNNPKVVHELGRKANEICEESRIQWEGVYHTIGNFTSIPWPENLQKRHLEFSERWDKLLKYCQGEWHKWDKKIINISFEEYLKLTCQHLYLKDIFYDFKERYFNRLDSIKTNEWDSLVKEWNKKIDEGKCKEIITFDDDIEEIVSNIIFLIEARGRCIISLLSQE